jgi:phytoene/squalene synthetase
VTNINALSTLYAVGQGRSGSSQELVTEVARTSDAALAKKITREASKQTYYTIRFLADRSLADAAYQAYAYFRWVDDILDDQLTSSEERLTFLLRQQMIVSRCTRGARPANLCAEETMVAELIGRNREPQSGMAIYIKEMMAVMAFDAQRKGRLVSTAELQEYTRSLATAVTEALHYCIGRGQYAPSGEARYHAVTAAHITHMLRDTIEDSANGYYNIPHNYLEQHGISPDDVDSLAYQAWVKSRVELARELFAKGRAHIAQVENLRCRLAGYAYIARFELVLDSIERDNYYLRPSYPERKSKRAAVKVGMGALWQALTIGRKQITINGSIDFGT